MKKDFSNNDITHRVNGDLEYITFNILDRYSDKLSHACFLKNGGVSSGDFNSLNTRLYGSDSFDNVLENYDIICKELVIDKIYKARQNHTDNILIIDDNNKEPYKVSRMNLEDYDGYITNTSNIATAITTADCNPIIIYDPVQNVVANIHSGWNGTIKQIYLKAIKLLNEKYKSKYEDIIVCIGPSINKCCFCSSDEKFKKLFTDIWKDEDKYITTKEKGKFYIDLPYVIKQDLINLGLKESNIVLSNICTVCNSDVCFSYRVSKKNSQKDYATMATITFLK
ncbi:MAG: peptidoglycan editing factor PgeF [Clostridia bacterium]